MLLDNSWIPENPAGSTSLLERALPKEVAKMTR
jgi:hypothetical protein